MDDAPKLVDVLVKAGALVVSCSMGWAFAYNFGFFISEQHWLGYFSFADHVATAIMIAPIAVILAAGPVIVLLKPRPKRGGLFERTVQRIVGFGPSEQILLPHQERRLFWVSTAIPTLGALVLVGLLVIIWRVYDNRVVAALQSVVLVVVWASLSALYKFASGEANRAQLAPYVAVVVFVVGFGQSATVGVFDRDNTTRQWLEVEVTGNNFYRGSIMRMIDAGIILRRADSELVFLPKIDVRRVTTVPRPAGSSASANTLKAQP